MRLASLDIYDLGLKRGCIKLGVLEFNLLNYWRYEGF